MLLHKIKKYATQTIEFHEVHRRAPKPTLVPKFNLGTRDSEPNDINYLQHQSPNKMRNIHKIRTKKSVQNQKKSHQKQLKSKIIVQNRSKSFPIRALLFVNN